MPSIAPGTRLDRYQIISLLGAGGMGEVYLAQDTRLGRKVALKFLPVRFTQDTERLRRFAQEAQAASALNHPNIITIYEVGRSDDTLFIATEYIEGLTLRRRLAQRRLTIDEALEIAIQTASALVAAHSAGIVHRDIKPENIMVRPDGYVKILDFGLAKLTERSDSTGSISPAQTGSIAEFPTAVETVDETVTSAEHEVDIPPPSAASTTLDIDEPTPVPAKHDTTPGVVMGTAQYMSPEHARGHKVDARTDIFSLGTVLYEMTTGVHPFTGTTRREVVAAVLYNDPPPVARFRNDVPELLEWTITKALTKDRDERYQTSRELLNDLRRLQQRLRVEREVARSHRTGTVPLESGRETGELGSTGELTGRTTSKLSGYLRRLRDRPSSAVLITGVLIVLAGLLYLLYMKLAQPPVPFRSMRVAPFTTSGIATRAAISPDGKYVVYVETDLGKQSLWVRQVAVTSNVIVVQPGEVLYRGLTFSHDGNYIFYVVQEGNNPIQVLYQVPVLGGQPRRLMTNVDSPVTFKPDGTEMAFVRRSRGTGEDSLIVASADGSNERRLATRHGTDFFGIGGPDWSLDGNTIATAAGSNAGGRYMNIVLIDVITGEEKPLSAQRWAGVGRVNWLRRGGLVVSATEPGSTLAQVWFLPYPAASSQVPVRITNDLNDYRDMSVTDDSRALVAVQSAAQVNVWLAPAGDSARARRITSGIGQYNGVRGLDWLSADHLVYVSRISGSQDIWTMKTDGTNQKQLTTPETGAEVYPVASPDGRSIVFVSPRSGNSNLYRIDPDGGNLRQLTRGSGEEFPDISPDGKWVIYNDTGSSKFTLWRVSIEGGEPVQLTTELSQWPDVSPNGKSIGCWYRSDPSQHWQLAVIPFEGGKATKILDVPTTANPSIPARWMPDGSGLCYVDVREGISNIWVQPIDGSQPRPITTFQGDQIFWFTWSRSGDTLSVSRGMVTSDVVLVTDAR
jgi:serine/threonine protein kinase/Tol biopolymer transport system component